MVDINYNKIKDRMKMRSMELWGIEQNKTIDPVIDLFIDVFSYELSRIYQEVKISDAKLLERISKILVNQNWSLPLPAHALLKVQPLEEIGKVDTNTQLYFQKIAKGGEEYLDFFFTPLKKQKLIKAKIYCTAIEQSITINGIKKTDNLTVKTYKDETIPDYTIWVGIELATSLLEKLDEIPISILLNDSDLNPYLKMVKVSDYDGNELELNQEEDKAEKKEHYYTSINRYYQDYLYTLNLTGSSKKKHSLTERCKTVFNEAGLEEYNTDLFWLQISFPVAFEKRELEKIEISLNTFPIVNRKLSYKQHNIKKNGKIVSLPSSDNEHFLNMESLVDNRGDIYNNALQNDLNNLEGSFSIYSGDLQQFDERNAKSILNQVMQTVREEGSSFSSVGYDLLNVYLEDLNSKLDDLEQKVNYKYKDVSDNSEKLYLLTIPYKTTDICECTYWTTNAHLANGIGKDSLLSPYQTIGLEAESILLCTGTVGGMLKNGKNEKINNLRYGLIAKDRIVSNEDVKEFVSITIGSSLKKVTVKSGVGISPERKQGLIRTIAIDVTLRGELNNENKNKLGHFLQLELENRSVHSTPYQVKII